MPPRFRILSEPMPCCFFPAAEVRTETRQDGLLFPPDRFSGHGTTCVYRRFSGSLEALDRSPRHAFIRVFPFKCRFVTFFLVSGSCFVFLPFENSWPHLVVACPRSLNQCQTSPSFIRLQILLPFEWLGARVYSKRKLPGPAFNHAMKETYLFTDLLRVHPTYGRQAVERVSTFKSFKTMCSTNSRIVTCSHRS